MMLHFQVLLMVWDIGTRGRGKRKGGLEWKEGLPEEKGFKLMTCAAGHRAVSTMGAGCPH